jgi:hypothetical protein
MTYGLRKKCRRTNLRFQCPILHPPSFIRGALSPPFASMGKFLAALFSLVLGAALGAVGIPLALWVAMALYRVEVARDWAVWLAERSPLPLYAPAVQVANDAIRRDSLIAAGLAAALLCLLAYSSLRFVRQALRSADESHDGKGTIELKTRPLRVGRPVEGSIWLTQGSERGQLYRVELSCKRDYGSGRSEGSETAYAEELEVAPVRTPIGWSLPFRFIVPPIAPPSGTSRHMSGPGYSWRLAFRRSKGWISFPSVFALHLAPAPLEELRALEKKEAPAQKQAIEEIVRRVGKEPVLYELAQLREPSAGDLETVRAGDPEGPSSAPRRAPNLFGEVTPGDARADNTVALNLSSGVSLTGKIVKWLFLVVFGGVLAVSAVALATAVLLSHIM